MRTRARVEGLELVRRVLPGGALSVYVAEDPDHLLEDLDEETFRATDERMPYFATLWPAGEALALDVLSGPRLDGARILDLGCGVGAAGLAALARGGRVTFLDWEPRALEVVALAARAQDLEPEALVTADWRRAAALGRFELVLAADVLYEARNLEAVVAFLAAHLAPRGEARLADPGRPHAAALPAALQAAGLHATPPRVLAARPQGAKVTLWPAHA